MRRFMTCACLSLLLLPASALAQQRPRLQIANVRVGFPGGHIDEEIGLEYAFKAGSFAPVFVDIQAGRDGLKGVEGRIDVIVETPDTDDVLTNYTVTVPLPELSPNGQFTVTTYTKVAGSTADLKVYLRYDGLPLGQPFVKQQSGKDSGQALYLAVGSRLPVLRQALQEKNAPNNNAPNNPDPLGRESVAYADQLHLLPQQWFGYQGVDLVILTTGKREFMEKLVEDKKRREALVEWVLRGGHLVVSVARNHEAVTAIPELAAILPVQIVKSEPVAGLRMAWVGSRTIQSLPAQAMDVSLFENKTGRRRPTALLHEWSNDGFKGGRTLAVRSEAGLGMVTVVAFDLEQRPFTDWAPAERNEKSPHFDFWRQLLAHAWQRDVLTHQQRDEQNNPMPGGMRMGMGDQTQLLSQLYAYLENFEEVPVISFFWVALFIFIYILVVGPLDYLFLKKVVKRLELTWITFPTVVLTVSALAYFTAYWLKGKDLRIRKVDVVDVDLASAQPQVQGHTWFTLFSPRIQHYTVGIEPGAPDWAAADAPPTALVSWLGRPDTDRYNPRARGQSLFRRSYDYEPNAAGLHGVPIQVWSTKSFTASWQAGIQKQRPLVKAELRQVVDPRTNRLTLAGSITWLPGDNSGSTGLGLTEAQLIFDKRVMRLKLEPGKPITVQTRDADPEFGAWFKETPMQLGQTMQLGNPTLGYAPYMHITNLDYIVNGSLFYASLQLNNHLHAGNSGLRQLDQSLRLRGIDEAILIGRLPVQKGPAEDVNAHPASASRLWLGALPAPGTPRPRLEGILQQDTYVRVFLPVAAADAKER